MKSGRNLAVEAYNTEGYMCSRGGRELAFNTPEVPEADRPQLWLVACGVTDYRDNQRLRSPYASKDARDISHALQMGADACSVSSGCTCRC